MISEKLAMEVVKELSKKPKKKNKALIFIKIDGKFIKIER